MKLSEQLKCAKLFPIKHIMSVNLSSCARGKVRYIGGYVVAKLNKYRTSLKIRSSLFATGKEI